MVTRPPIPAPTTTIRSADSTGMTRDIPGRIAHGLEGVPLGELVDPLDVAALTVHLMTDESRAITGSVFTIDAGRTAV